MICSNSKNVYKTNDISMILVFHWCNPDVKPSQIRIWCSRTKKCSQRHEINHLCLWIFQPFNLKNFFPNPVGEPPLRLNTSNARSTYKTRPKLEKFSELEVGMFRAAHETYFEIYSSSIGVLNQITSSTANQTNSSKSKQSIKSNQVISSQSLISNQTKANPINSINQINQVHN